MNVMNNLSIPVEATISAPATDSTLKKALVTALRLSMGWTFLYAGANQLLNPKWTAVGFLGRAKTFPELFAWFGSPAILPYTNFMVEWGHLLIGIALILGICVRLGAGFGALLMLLYYLPRLDFPMVGAHNFIVEYHLVYGTILIYLAAIKAGQVWGLENWVAGHRLAQPVFAKYPKLRDWLS